MGGMATLGFEVRHLHPFTGAEVMGLALAEPLGAGQRSACSCSVASASKRDPSRGPSRRPSGS